MVAALVVLLILAGIGLAGIGGLLLSSATLGVGLIGLAIFAAVLARIAQAADHHEQHVKRLRQQDEATRAYYAGQSHAASR